MVISDYNDLNMRGTPIVHSVCLQQLLLYQSYENSSYKGTLNQNVMGLHQLVSLLFN